MKIGRCCSQTVLAIEADASLWEVAGMMQDCDFSEIVVVHEAGTLITPIGIITYQDLANRLPLNATSMDSLTARDVMSSRLLTVREEDDLDTALVEMQARDVKRAPVIDDDGALVGILLLHKLQPGTSSLHISSLTGHSGDAAGNFITYHSSNSCPVSAYAWPGSSAEHSYPHDTPVISMPAASRGRSRA